MDSAESAALASDEGTVNVGRIGAFLALAFGLSWTSALGMYLAGIELDTPVGLLVTVTAFMWAPAIAAIGVLWRSGDPIRATVGLRFGRPEWLILAWVAPVGFVAATIAVGAAIPGATITTDYGTYLLDLGLTQEQADVAAAELEAFPGPVAALLVVQGLVAGATINALAALGEELGWRGLLLAELSPLGFWKVSGLTGAIWGVWHAPVILQGHNFPDAPFAGVVVMTVATLAIAPVYTYLAVRAESVLAATVFHGSFNGLGALSLVYLTGAGNLVLSPVGAAGVGAALLATACCLAHDRFVADVPIATGDPLTPWS